MSEEPRKSTILEEARKRVFNENQVKYGHPAINFAQVGEMWTLILRARGHVIDDPLDAHTVALMMQAWKMCRLLRGYDRDSVKDMAGYAQTMELIDDFMNK